MWIKMTIRILGVAIYLLAVNFKAGTSFQGMRAAKRSARHQHARDSIATIIASDSDVSNDDVGIINHHGLPDMKELEHILSIAETAARRAGILIRENIGARVKYSKTNYKVGLFPNVTNCCIIKRLQLINYLYKALVVFTNFI